MRYSYALISLLFVFSGYAQTNKKIIFSGVIINHDSVPVPNVAIISARTFKTVRTDSLGFFKTETEEKDSLLVHHIAYKKLFISAKDNGKYTVIVPETHELRQVDIKQDYQKTLKNNLANIQELARQKKLTKEELKSLSQKFTDQHGSHNKGFVPFFGLTTQVSYGRIAELISSHQSKKQRKRLTSHYHLIKEKPTKRKK